MKIMNTIAAIKSTRKGHAKNKTKDKRISTKLVSLLQK